MFILDEKLKTSCFMHIDEFAAALSRQWKYFIRTFRLLFHFSKAKTLFYLYLVENFSDISQKKEVSERILIKHLGFPSCL